MPITCADDYRVLIYDRGGQRRLGEIVGASRIQWERIRDEISEATVTLSRRACEQQIDALGLVEPMRVEMVLYRGEDRVWEGPVTRLGDVGVTGEVEIAARDIMVYAYRTPIEHAYSSAYPNVESSVNRAARIFETEMAGWEEIDPPANIVPHLVEHSFPDDAETTAATAAFQYTVYEHIDNLAHYAGLDYTVIGRSLHLWDVHRDVMGRTRTLTQNDFLGNVTVSLYGMEFGARAIVTNGEGVYGEAVGPNGFPDPYYGLWTRLDTAYDETEGEDPPTQAEMESQAQRNLAGRNPVPLQVRIPDGSSLNPNGAMSISDLVPGTRVPLLADLSFRKVSQLQTLNRVRFSADADGEDISVTLFPSPNETPEEET